MLYAKIKNGAVEIYPFGGPDALRGLHPQTSFPATMSQQLLDEYGVVTVTPTAKPDDTRLHFYREVEPVLSNGQWVQTWQQVARDAPAVTDYDQAVARRARARRDALLQRCDFTQLADAGVANAAEWAAFRQALRAVPQQPGFPHNISWPAIPAGARLEE